MNFVLKQLPLPGRMRLLKPMNDEELMRFCALNSDLCIEREPEGDLVVMAPAGSEIGAVELHIGAQLLAWARVDGRGKVFGPSSGFTLPDNSVRMPDAAWVSLERWNALTRSQQSRFAPVCPEFVIEVRSQSDRLVPMQAKMQMWIANGAQVAWLIDPSRAEVSIYRPGDKPEVLHDRNSVEGTGPVTGFELVLD